MVDVSGVLFGNLVKLNGMLILNGDMWINYVIFGIFVFDYMIFLDGMKFFYIVDED